MFQASCVFWDPGQINTFLDIDANCLLVNDFMVIQDEILDYERKVHAMTADMKRPMLPLDHFWVRQLLGWIIFDIKIVVIHQLCYLEENKHRKLSKYDHQNQTMSIVKLHIIVVVQVYLSFLSNWNSGLEHIEEVRAFLQGLDLLLYNISFIFSQPRLLHLIDIPLHLLFQYLLALTLAKQSSAPLCLICAEALPEVFGLQTTESGG